jgi:hypothetical protein
MSSGVDAKGKDTYDQSFRYPAINLWGKDASKKIEAITQEGLKNILSKDRGKLGQEYEKKKAENTPMVK